MKKMSLIKKKNYDFFKKKKKKDNFDKIEILGNQAN